MKAMFVTLAMLLGIQILSAQTSGITDPQIEQIVLAAKERAANLNPLDPKEASCDYYDDGDIGRQRNIEKFNETLKFVKTLPDGEVHGTCKADQPIHDTNSSTQCPEYVELFYLNLVLCTVYESQHLQPSRGLSTLTMIDYYVKNGILEEIKLSAQQKSNLYAMKKYLDNTYLADKKKKEDAALDLIKDVTIIKTTEWVNGLLFPELEKGIIIQYSSWAHINYVGQKWVIGEKVKIPAQFNNNILAYDCFQNLLITGSSSSQDSEICLFDWKQNKLLKQVSVSGFRAYDAAISAEGDYVAFSDDRGKIKILSLPDLSLLNEAAPFKEGRGAPVAFCPGGKVIVGASENTYFRVYDVKEGKLLPGAPESKSIIQRMHLMPQVGKILLRTNSGAFFLDCTDNSVEKFNYPKEYAYSSMGTTRMANSADGKYFVEMMLTPIDGELGGTPTLPVLVDTSTMQTKFIEAYGSSALEKMIGGGQEARCMGVSQDGKDIFVGIGKSVLVFPVK